MPTADPHIYLTQAEAADVLRISARSLERWRLEGTGPAYRKFGRRVVYGRADLETWAESRVFTSTSESERP